VSFPSRPLAPLLVALAVVASGCGATLKRFAYEGIGRDRWQRPQQVIESLELRAGDRVADLGAGAGYFTYRLAEAVGRTGRVFAVDVDEELLDYVAEEAAERGLGNVDVVRAAPDDPRLPLAGVDVVFTCNTYHHLPDRSAYFARLRARLQPGGRVAIVDFRPGGWFGSGHATPAETIRAEMEAAGYALLREHDFLPRQVFLVFGPKPG
jgi:ubiquinone/menaquinone biosynthesis C-methylase UbiE